MVRTKKPRSSPIGSGVMWSSPWMAPGRGDWFGHADMMRDVPDPNLPDTAAAGGRRDRGSRRPGSPPLPDPAEPDRSPACGRRWVIGERIPLTIHEVPSGTPALDWTVPREWTLRDAWVEDAAGRRVIDIADHGLHVVGYSPPVDREVDRAELLEHLHGLPDRPDWIPYRTSYYRRDVGLLRVAADDRRAARGGIACGSTRTSRTGRLTYGELLLPGSIADEVLHHPPMSAIR